jgi:hypothetical protein
VPLLQLPFLLEPEVGEALLVVEEQTARASAQQEPPLPALPNSFRTSRKISFPRQPAFRNSDKTAPFFFLHVFLLHGTIHWPYLPPTGCFFKKLPICEKPSADQVEP